MDRRCNLEMHSEMSKAVVKKKKREKKEERKRDKNRRAGAQSVQNLSD